MLNRIWTFFFIGGFAAAIVRAFMGHSEVWRDIVGSTFDLSLIHISEPTRLKTRSRMPSSA